MGGVTSSAVAKLTKRPNKRKIEPGTDKVMPTGKPRTAVTRVSVDGAAKPDADSTTKTDDLAPAGTAARAEQIAAKKAEDEAAKSKRKRGNKRVTAKGTVSPKGNTRYTPPTAKFEDMPSPLWVPILMFTLFALGMLTIFLNYVGLLPSATSNWYLLLGLGFILGGIITATQYR